MKKGGAGGENSKRKKNKGGKQNNVTNEHQNENTSVPNSPKPVPKVSEQQISKKTSVESKSDKSSQLPHSKTLRIAVNPCEIPSHHSGTYLTSFNNPEIYNKLSLQTLFFIFYNYGGSKAQILAANALKKRDWRFHTQLNTWCQRSSAPHVVEKDYEQGPYVTFDYHNFVQKCENNFKFEYRFLEHQ